MSEAAPLEAGAARVSETSDGNYTQVATNGRHRWSADEPVAAGGRDAGPTPYELLCSSLAACTAITTRMYADRKGWPLASIAVDVRHSAIHAEDCAECETEKGMVGRLDKTVRLTGDLDPEQTARLLEIAERCPVQRTLTREIRIVSAHTVNGS